MADLLDSWIGTLAAALDIAPDDVDRDVVLDLAKNAAHQVTHPAAPLTTYLVGFAAGRAGASAAGLKDAASVADDVIRAWETDEHVAAT
jgi:hypothetical protein